MQPKTIKGPNSISLLKFPFATRNDRVELFMNGRIIFIHTILIVHILTPLTFTVQEDITTLGDFDVFEKWTIK